MLLWPQTDQSNIKGVSDEISHMGAQKNSVQTL